MRRSICYSEPSNTLAGEVFTWRFIYTTATNLPKGTLLRFDLQSLGRDIDWELPQTNLKDKKNLIWAEIQEGKAIPATSVDVKGSFAPVYDFTLPSEVKAGDSVTICLGTPNKEESKKHGNRAQTTVFRRRAFHLYIDPKAKGDFKDPEVFSMDIRGNVLYNIRIVTPSIVSKNKRFDVIVRFEDQFGNLTNNAPEGTLIDLSYEHLRENLNWKLFVPETGFINLPNLYFNEAGVYKIQLHNTNTGDKFYSYPIKCFTDINYSIFWGLLHGESDRVDSTENIEPCLRHFRDEKSLQFYATSSFESAEETSPELWKTASGYIAEFNEDYRFNTFLGFQWCGEAGEEGLRDIIYAKDNKPICRKKDVKTNTLKKIYKGTVQKEILAVPSFTMAKGYHYDFKDFTPDVERVVEIYNAWGSSECTTKEGNLRPIATTGKSGVVETQEGSIKNALLKNCRFGFVAGGLDDRGIFADFFESDQVQYSPGLTAIISVEQTREALYQALYNRQCYATTGERIILGFAIAGANMGSELNTKAKPGLVLNRHITGYVAGSSEIKEVQILRNGTLAHTLTPKTNYFEFAHDDTKHLAECAIESSDDRPHFVFYYLRVIQTNGHIAWSSPIWIDYPEMKNAPIPAPAPKKAKKK